MSEEAKRKYRLALRLWKAAMYDFSHGATAKQRSNADSQAYHYETRIQVLVEGEYGTGIIDAATL